MKISLAILLLLIIQISLLPFRISARSSRIPKSAKQTTVTSQASNEAPSAETFVLKEPQELEIIPGVTKQLIIQLKGESEDITFYITSNETDPSLFTTSIFSNGKLETVYNYQSLKPETLSTSFEYQTGLMFTLSGSNGFSLITPVPEDQNYHLNTTLERHPTFEEDKAQNFVSLDKSGSNMFAITATAGAFGLVMLVAKVGLTVKRRRYGGAHDLIRLCQENRNLSKKLDDAVLFNARLLKSKDCKDNKNSNLQEFVGNLFETSSSTADVEAVKSQQNRGPVSLASTCATLTTLPEQKAAPCSPPLTLKRIHEEIKARTKAFAEDNHGFELTLDMDSDDEHDHKRVPTTKDIKDLVRRMEEEGTLGYDCDPSAESNDEDQYEAPQLPNYVCCMLCFEGRRCNIVNPCRHVFACTECMDDLMEKYKVCVLCSKQISGYEPL